VYYIEAAGLVANRMYHNIHTFSGGMKAWKAAGYKSQKNNPLPAFEVETIDSASFKKDFQNCCVVDIRMRKNYAMGLYTKYLNNEMSSLSSEHRKKYIHKIPLPHLSSRYKKIAEDKKVVVVDYKGKQAPLAVRFLKSVGYDPVYMLKDGLISFAD
jgi:rhodanese-related sulfurtransferase